MAGWKFGHLGRLVLLGRFGQLGVGGDSWRWFIRLSKIWKLTRVMAPVLVLEYLIKVAVWVSVSKVTV